MLALSYLHRQPRCGRRKEMQGGVYSACATRQLLATITEIQINKGAVCRDGVQSDLIYNQPEGESTNIVSWSSGGEPVK